MKQAKELLLQLPETERDRFQIEFQKDREDITWEEWNELSFADLPTVIARGFTWAKTAQGQSYWSAICEREKLKLNQIAP